MLTIFFFQDPGDLNVKEGERVVITDRTSEDWWTAEVDGKSGLVPASYVKLL
jgi:abl interactor 2